MPLPKKMTPLQQSVITFIISLSGSTLIILTITLMLKTYNAVWQIPGPYSVLIGSLWLLSMITMIWSLRVMWTNPPPSKEE